MRADRNRILTVITLPSTTVWFFDGTSLALRWNQVVACNCFLLRMQISVDYAGNGQSFPQ